MSQTPTINLSSPIVDLVKVATGDRKSKALARFDAGQGREILVVAIVNDVNGYLRTMQAYEESRDEYANSVANAVAADIAENGLPDPDNPKPFNIVESSDDDGK